MHRQPIVIANWKMHTSLAEATTLVQRYVRLAEAAEDVEVVVLPPTIWLPSLVEAYHRRPRNLRFGIQNVFPKLEGAFTGETGLEMIRGLADYVLVGHSERRTLFHEDGPFINQKLRAVLAAGLTPILCVGELTPVMLKSRSRGRPTVLERESDLRRQVETALDQVHERDAERLIVAYEPLWAVGTDNNVPGPAVSAIVEILRDLIADHLGRPTAGRVRMVYGGNVNEATIGEYLLQPSIDGVLVGRAALDIRLFEPIVMAAADRNRHAVQHTGHGG